jgi:hypothetical protein
MIDRLTKKDAEARIGLDDKTFMNYLNAGEFQCLERNNGRGRYFFDPQVIDIWKKQQDENTVMLTKDDYALCLDFALAQHFRKYVTSDFGTGRQREFGQKLTNWIKGQLGEVAVKKLLKEKYACEIDLDFEIHDEIVPQDIVSVSQNGNSRPPRIGVGIKSSKPKNVYLVLGENEINLPERRSDVYIYCRPDLPDDHLLRIAKESIMAVVKNKPHYGRYQAVIPDFRDIPCEVVGWCRYQDLRETNEIPGQKFEGGTRFVIETGKLKRTSVNWYELVSLL